MFGSPGNFEGSTPDKVHVYLFAADVAPRSLDISLQQHLLTVAGERRVTAEEAVDYYRKERFDGAFRRVVALPDDIDSDQVEVTRRAGMLHIAVEPHRFPCPAILPRAGLLGGVVGAALLSSQLPGQLAQA